MIRHCVVYVYNGIQFSKEKNEIMPFAAIWIEFEMVTLRGVSQRESDKYHVISFMYGN